MVLRFLNRSSQRANHPAPQQGDPDTRHVTISSQEQALTESSADELHKSTVENLEPENESRSSGRELFLRSSSDSESPILNAQDERFLQRITSETDAPPLPPRPTLISEDGVSIGEGSVDEGSTAPNSSAELSENEASRDVDATEESKWSRFVPTFNLSSSGSIAWYGWTRASTEEKDRKAAAETLQAAADEVKSRQAKEVGEEEQEEERKELGSILNNLNLSAINNRVVGISKDTQNLLEKFNLIVKDLINGVPTAYDDLEKLLKERSSQLERLYENLPPFIQKLIKSIPTKMYAFLAPQVAAAMAPKDKSSQDHTSEKKDRKRKKEIPSLRRLLTEKGAIAAMFQSIVEFLELRFPAFLPFTNVIMSLALFILLFVFWYCYKRGREVRIAKESADADEAAAKEIEGGSGAEGPNAEEQDDTQEGNLPQPNKDLEDGIERMAKDLEQPSKELS